MSKNHIHILKHTASYIPSKLLVGINTLIIVPLYAHLLEVKEMSIYFIAIQFLNIMCTVSSDWITKSILRFHEKFNIQNRIEDFYSNILSFSIFTQIIVMLIYFSCSNLLQLYLGVDFLTIILSACLVIPSGIRQLLFQYLRVKDKSFLYTVSILFYQILNILIFLILVKHVPNANSILISMNIAMFIIDMYILNYIDFDIKPRFKFDIKITKEIIQYASPLVITNICYWVIMHFSKLYFQYKSIFLYTAIIGFFHLFTYNILQPFASVFMFAGFPELVHKYEHNIPIKKYWTSIIQLYSVCILPIVMTFLYFHKEITSLFFPKEYLVGSIILPLFAFSLFIHELIKLVNTKFHLKNKTNIEMIIALCSLSLLVAANIILMQKFSLFGAGLAFFISELFLLIFNTCIKIENFEFLNYFSIIKSIVIISLIGIFTYAIIIAPFIFIYKTTVLSAGINITKIILFATIYYFICYLFRNYILKT